MISTLIAAVAATVIGTATPAPAEGKAATDSATATVAVVSTPIASPVGPVSNNRQRYCVVEKLTGSRLPVRTCQTRADWLAQGFDPIVK